ncbi:HAMP domain-containing histidine kinase [candidate division KSB1 bacterium]|nr:HAMP domain-containing histidine kinase [candidate division KSB1 bacterium]
MKLLTKLQRYYIAFTPIALIACGIAGYFIISSFSPSGSEKRLYFHKAKALADLRSGKVVASDNDIEILEVDPGLRIVEQLSHSIIVEPHADKQISYRQLQFTEFINGRNYKITIRNPVSEGERITAVISKALLGVFLTLIATVFLTNIWATKKIWQPFYHNLTKMKNYNLSHDEQLDLTRTDIDEFNELNQVVDKMTKKIRKDYLSLKEFTENASHEIQTPLAIIKSRLELLLQSESLSEEQTKLIKPANDAATKLSRLNRALLLLTKIENKQFEYEEKINFKTLIERQLGELVELINLKQIKLEKHLADSKCIYMSPELADILVQNLLKNALKYVDKQGAVKIDLSGSQLAISNSGPLTTRPDQVFERFKKGKGSQDSLGLGLAIVKKICEAYELQIKYTYQDNNHVFQISF